MVIGGVPKYWTYIQQGLSTSETIERLLLDKDGYLYQEFEELYSSLFDDYKIWSGYQFENICIKHTNQIKCSLGISGIYMEVSCWYDKKNQIDLLIERADKSIHLCEIKYYDDKISSTRSIADSMDKKKSAFVKASLTKKSIIKTLISTYGTRSPSPNIDKNVTLEDLFVNI